MKHRHIAQMGSVLAATFVVGVALAAQDRYTLKSPNGITFLEFKGYAKARDYVYTSYAKR